MVGQAFIVLNIRSVTTWWHWALNWTRFDTHSNEQHCRSYFYTCTKFSTTARMQLYYYALLEHRTPLLHIRTLTGKHSAKSIVFKVTETRQSELLLLASWQCSPVQETLSTCNNVQFLSGSETRQELTDGMSSFLTCSTACFNLIVARFLASSTVTRTWRSSFKCSHLALPRICSSCTQRQIRCNQSIC